MEQQKKKRTAGICLTLAGGICWGLSGCFGQYLFQKKDITADWLVMVRLLLAGVLLVLMGFLLTKKRMGGYLEKSCGQKAALDFFCFCMLSCQYTYFAAIQYSNAGTATVLQSWRLC